MEGTGAPMMALRTATIISGKSKFAMIVRIISAIVVVVVVAVMDNNSDIICTSEGAPPSSPGKKKNFGSIQLWLYFFKFSTAGA